MITPGERDNVIAGNLRKLMKERGLTLMGLVIASERSIHPIRLREILEGLEAITLEEWCTIAHALKVRTGDLLPHHLLDEAWLDSGIYVDSDYEGAMKRRRTGGDKLEQGLLMERMDSFRAHEWRHADAQMMLTPHDRERWKEMLRTTPSLAW